jgi:hypothetical protein
MSCDLPLPKTETTADEKTLEQPNENVCNKLRNTLQGLVDQQKVLRRSVADLQVQPADSASAEASIFASKSIRAGVTLRINGVQRKFTSSLLPETLESTSLANLAALVSTFFAVDPVALLANIELLATYNDGREVYEATSTP